MPIETENPAIDPSGQFEIEGVKKVENLLIIKDGENEYAINNLKHINLKFNFGVGGEFSLPLSILQDILIQSFKSRD